MKANLIVAASSALVLLSAVAFADSSSNSTPSSVERNANPPAAVANPGCGDSTIRSYPNPHSNANGGIPQSYSRNYNAAYSQGGSHVDRLRSNTSSNTAKWNVTTNRAQVRDNSHLAVVHTVRVVKQ